MLKAFDTVGLLSLCSVAWRSGTVPVEWQTGVVVSKKGDHRVCSNYRVMTLLSLLGKVYSRELGKEVFTLAVDQWTSSTLRWGYCPKFLGVLFRWEDGAGDAQGGSGRRLLQRRHCIESSG